MAELNVDVDVGAGAGAGAGEGAGAGAGDAQPASSATSSEGDATLLLRACRDGSVDIIKQELERGIHVNTETAEGFPPLHLAILGAHEHAMNLCLQEGASVDAGSRGFTALHVAADAGFVAAIQPLIARGATMDAPDAMSATALHRCAAAGHVEFAMVCLKRGANPSARDVLKRTPLHLAAAYGRSSCVKVLVGETLGRAIDDMGRTPADVASPSLDEEAKTLLNRKFNAATSPQRSASSAKLGGNEGDGLQRTASGASEHKFGTKDDDGYAVPSAAVTPSRPEEPRPSRPEMRSSSRRLLVPAP